MKNIFAVPLFVAALLALLIGAGTLNAPAQDGTQTSVLPQQAQNPDVEQELQAVLQVEERIYQVRLPSEGESVLGVMELASKQHEFTFEGRDFLGLGFFVESINGKKQSQREGKYWIYSVNGQKAKVGVSQYFIQPNDVITWSYESEDTY